MLDMFHAHKKLPLLPSPGNEQKVFPKAGTLGNANSFEDVNKMDAYGTGLKNEVGEYNCFLNVIIQVCVHWDLSFFSIIGVSSLIYSYCIFTWSML